MSLSAHYPEARLPIDGMVCMAIAMLLLPVGDTFAKLLTERQINPVEVTMWRFMAQAAFVAGTAGMLRHRLRGDMFSPVVALSGLLVMITLSALISAFAVMPIATAIAIFFVEPLILTLLAGPLLKETIGLRRLAAVVIGLIGAMVVIRPGFSAYGLATLLPLIAATTYALNMIVLRFASRTRSGLTIQCGASAYAAAGMVLIVVSLNTFGVLDVRPSTYPTWAWGAVAGAGAFAAASFLLIAEAFRRAEVSILAPFQYLEIVGATAAGFVVFGDFPDALTWLGIAIILASGLYVFRREEVQDAEVPRRRTTR